MMRTWIKISKCRLRFTRKRASTSSISIDLGQLMAVLEAHPTNLGRRPAPNFFLEQVAT